MTARPDDWERVTRERARILQRNILSLRRWADGAASEDREDAEKVFEMLARRSFQALEEITFEDLPLARLLDQADLVMRVDGDATSHRGSARVSLVAKFLTSVQRALGQIVRELARGSGVNWQQLADLTFLGTAPGSLYIGFAVPHPEDLGELPGIAPVDAVKLLGDALRCLAEGSNAVAEEAPLEKLEKQLPDPRVRDVVLSSVHTLAPARGSGVKLIELSGSGAPATALTLETRASSSVLLKETATRAKTRASYVGTVREIDLDAKRFELRGIAEVGTLRCAYETAESETPKAWVDARVEVRGMVEVDRKGAPALMWVAVVKALDGNSPDDSSPPNES